VLKGSSGSRNAWRLHQACKVAGQQYRRVARFQTTIWIADAHRDDGKRFLVHTDEKLTAFLELESAIRPASVKLSLL
jgi:hypothetical protein